MKIPNFFVIGAAKSGTTSLCALLEQHPQVSMSMPKEPRFFSMDQNYHKGWDWYMEHFKGSQGALAVGEGSANYTMLPKFDQTAARIAKDLPQARLIYIVRHPVDRMISHWKMLRYRRHQFPDFAEVVCSPSFGHHFIDRSRYWYQLQPYRRYFPDERIHTIVFEHFIDQPSKTIQPVFEFLEVEPDIHCNLDRAHNAGHTRLRETKLTVWAKQLPLYKSLMRLMPIKFKITLINIYNRRFFSPSVDERTLTRAIEKIKPDAEAFLSHFHHAPETWSFDIGKNLAKF